jgi:hypothetical protein
LHLNNWYRPHDRDLVRWIGISAAPLAVPVAQGDDAIPRPQFLIADFGFWIGFNGATIIRSRKVIPFYEYPEDPRRFWRVRLSIERGRPHGSDDWVEQTVMPRKAFTC